MTAEQIEALAALIRYNDESGYLGGYMASNRYGKYVEFDSVLDALGLEERFVIDENGIGCDKIVPKA